MYFSADNARDRLKRGHDLRRVLGRQALGIHYHPPLLDLHHRSRQVELMFQQASGISGDIFVGRGCRSPREPNNQAQEKSGNRE
ncbi:MAG: hypothetical protein QM771_08745 [Nitrospira sp.]